MKNKFLVAILVVFQSINVFGQQKEKEVLFTIDGNPYYTDEFIRVYNKNLDLVKDDSQKDLDVYFDLFLGYKLKVAKAYKNGYQNSDKYQNELKSYRNQLSKNYIYDSKVTQALTEEAYQRGLKEIRASHILILVDENAAPTDTLKAYNEIIRIKKEIQNGKSFEDAAAEFSQDPSARENKGDLGYFSAFRMVYDFENAAFNTPKGDVSKPFRTRFGYHILKVNDIRDNQGEVTVAHIMTSLGEGNNNEEVAKTKILEINQKLKQGETFEALAKQFSDDKSSAEKGGMLQRFGTGQLSSSEFENAAFSLKNNGDISEPFKSQFGWHIVKLIEKHPLKTFEESKFEIENKIKRDERSKIISTNLTEKLRKKYTTKTDSKVLEQVTKTVTEDFYKQTWEVSDDAKKSLTKDLLTINNTSKIKADSFVNFLVEQQKSGIQTKPISSLVNQLYEKFIDKELNTFYDANLESEFPEFHHIMNEYREGLLLFDLMEKEIWERAKTDTIGQQEFYAKNISNYNWKKRFQTQIYSSASKSELEKALKLAKKGKSEEFIKDKANTLEKVNISVQTGLFEENDNVLPKDLNINKGFSEIIKQGEFYYFLNTSDILMPSTKEFKEVRGKVINDYQQFLEANWVSELKKEVQINVDKTVFEKIKKQLQK